MTALSPEELEALLARAYADPEHAEALLRAGLPTPESLDRVGLAFAVGSFARKRAHLAHAQPPWWRRVLRACRALLPFSRGGRRAG